MNDERIWTHGGIRWSVHKDAHEARHFTLGQTIEPRPTRVHFISEGEHLVYETFDAVPDVAAATEAQLEAWLKRAQRQ